jgi:tetratricopeptide (TPR) repeat protein
MEQEERTTRRANAASGRPWGVGGIRVRLLCGWLGLWVCLACGYPRSEWEFERELNRADRLRDREAWDEARALYWQLAFQAPSDERLRYIRFRIAQLHELRGDYEGALDAYAEHLEQGGVRADVRRSDPEFIALHRRLARFETTLSDYYEQTCNATPGLVRNTLQKRVSKFRQRFIAFVHAKQDECSDDATVWIVAAEVMERLREAGARTGALPRGSQ